MKLIERESTNFGPVSYYKGVDINQISKHPRDGTKGMIVCFFDSIQTEERNNRLKNLTEDVQLPKFVDQVENINNPYVLIYETKGYHDIIYKSIKEKLENGQISWSVQEGRRI